MLKDAKFKGVYDSGTSNNEPRNFYLTALSKSISFDLGLGYFSSSGFRALSYGFAGFISRGGTMRIIMNNILSADDKKAIEKGQISNPDELIEEKIVDDIDKLNKTLAGRDRHFFNCLSWLVAKKKLEMIAIVPRSNSRGIAHEKYGIFKDEKGNQVIFTGSANFSYNAFYHNIESISCFNSWTEESKENAERIAYYTTRFKDIWTGQNPAVRTIPIEKVKTVVQEQFPLETNSDLLQEAQDIMRETLQEERISTDFREKLEYEDKQLPATKEDLKNPMYPAGFKVRDYQKEAVEAWSKNNYQGFFEMATGTGKTATGLLASLKLFEKEKRIFLLILVPTKDLTMQWKQEVKKFNYADVHIGSSDFPNWKKNLQGAINSFNLGNIKHTVLISTYKSFGTSNFPKLPDETMLIADEAHCTGAEGAQKKLPYAIKYRLGLSATPHRYFDEPGTQRLLGFFNAVDKSTFIFSMGEAIKKGYLCEYRLYPYFAELNEEEFERYIALTKKIARIMHANGDKVNEGDGALGGLLIKRRKILNQAAEKLDVLNEIITKMKEKGEIHHTLVYCPEGNEKEGRRVIDKYSRLLGHRHDLRVRQFIGTTPAKKRQAILKQFDEGKLQVLLAMKCLDEGIDIKQTETAIFISSSTNPRQYIQRRGRVLRPHPKKSFAHLYDIIAMPPQDLYSLQDNDVKKTEKKIFTQEFKRYRELADDSVNFVEAMKPIYPILKKYDINLYE